MGYARRLVMPIIRKEGAKRAFLSVGAPFREPEG
jgi:hypothetical protein